MEKIICRNPITLESIKELDCTAIEQVPEIYRRSQEAQHRWAQIKVKARAKRLLDLRETLIGKTEEVIDVIVQETGKPRFEALSNEVLACIDTISYLAQAAPHVLKSKRIPLRLLKHRKSTIHFEPLGTVLIISPWNYPFLLPFAQICAALVAGNSVIFKPSEVTSLTGLKIQQLLDEAGLPSHILQTVIGTGTLGSALVEAKPSKVFFTGSVSTGKKIMSAASQNLTPVNLELGGKDAMIVLPDAPIDYATSAALWGGYSNSGQVCASVERLIVHESIAPQFIKSLADKIARLRQGQTHDSERDLGVTTYEKQKEVYQAQIAQAKAHGAQFIAGGEFSNDQRYLLPTLVTGKNIEELDIYREETFGPVIALTTFKSVDEAVQKANQNRYALLASVITKNLSLGNRIAMQLEAGTVTINEVTYTAGVPETPWGGRKDSGFGTTHSIYGLLELVHTKHIHAPRFSFLYFKSPWWFPYSDYQYAAFRQLIELYRRSWVDKLRAFPLFLWNLLQLIKREKRF